jgi:eukaryotic-like serine/threonine-protein kinase
MVEQEIGRGPLGVIYRVAGSDGSKAALKYLSPEAIRDPEAITRFIGETLGLRRLTHPQLARFYEAGAHAGQAYYVREWVDGVDLSTSLKNSHSPDAWRSLGIPLAVQIGRALHHGHRRSLLHRRLTATNVIIAKDGSVKVTDFGIAKIVSVPPLSLTGEAAASLAYLSPEHFTGKPYTKRSDLYSLGAVIYAAVTGRAPFTAGSPSEYMHKHCYLLPDRPASFVPKIPNELDELICTLMQKDPARRLTTSLAVVEELDRIRGKLERKGDTIPWPADPGDTNLHTALSDTAIAALQGDPGDDRSRPLLNRMAIVVPLLMVVIGLIGWLLFRPGPSAEWYFKNAETLLATGQSTDADKAWDDYLEPLQRKYPDQYVREIAQFRDQRLLKRELSRAIEQGQRASYGNDVERMYARALALMRIGDFAESKQIFEQLLKRTNLGDKIHEQSKAGLEMIDRAVRSQP